MPATNYGTCMMMLDDMSNPARMLTGQDVLIQDIYHLLTTQRGTMATNPEFGFGLSDELLSSRDADGFPALASSIQSALEDDDRIASADVDIRPDPSGEVVVDIQIDPVEGVPFRLTGTLESLLTELTGGQDL